MGNMRKSRRVAKQRRLIEQERRRKDEQYRQELLRQANYDAVTGIFNQNGFFQRTNEMLRENPGGTFTIFRINIRGFKILNEVYGFQRGTEVLIRIAEKLKHDVGGKGAYGRLYSDHFAVFYPLEVENISITPGITNLRLTCSGQEIRVKLEVGVYSSKGQDMDAPTMLDYAQIALQNHDPAVTNGFYFYKDAYWTAMLKKERITNCMEEALQQGQFHVFLQPQYNITSHQLVGAEALVRWFDPSVGVIPPGEFIPVFENNGFIYRLDLYVCDQVCQMLARWRQQGKAVPVSVNLSRVDLQNRNLAEQITATLQKYQIPKELLHLEVTESSYVDGPGELNKAVYQLKKLGFVIEMDDFGHGYSSFNMLKDVAVDVLKLDMGFLNRETNMDKGGMVIESLVKLAHSMGIAVIAEGVENERESNFLKAIGCRMVQGYLYGKPMPEDSFEELLEQSDIGMKMSWRTTADESNRDGLYWAMEKVSILLRYADCAIAEYIPTEDTMGMLWIGRKGTLEEAELKEWTRRPVNSCPIHPDYKKLVDENLLVTGDKLVEFDFLADYAGTGDYRWYHASQRRYGVEGTSNRVIAVIREKKGVSPEHRD